MKNVVVVGTQWGDEGKGKIIDIFAEFAELIIRFQGGANAGHTLVVDGEKLVTHLIPSGVLHRGKRSAIGPSVVIDPQELISEIDMLQKRGLLQEAGTLVVSDRAQVVMPYHRLLDAARETARGEKKLGTTLRGIGPCLEDKMSRSGIRMCEFLDPQVLGERLSQRLPEVNALLAYYRQPGVDQSTLLQKAVEQAARLAPFVGDVGFHIRQEMQRHGKLLFEGAQGSLLDVDHGTYPFVTSSNTVAGAACTALGFGPKLISQIVGVVKAYTTRVGEGPFPTELSGDQGAKLREIGCEFGATTGRPRRCGWLDLFALRYVMAINGCTSLALTKLDVLTDIGSIKVAVGYRFKGQELESFPADANILKQVEPVYEELGGWEEDIRDARERTDLPLATRRYIERIESYLHVPVELISVGPNRSETIMVQNPFGKA